MMTEADTKRVLRHLSRLTREAVALLHDRPLDELAHAMWSDRVDRYLAREFPETEPRRPDELVDVEMPDLLDPHRKRPDPMDAAIARASSGRQLIMRQLTVLASKAERLEMGKMSSTWPPLLASCLLAMGTGCGRETIPTPCVVPPGVSWASMLSDAADLRTLAAPVEATAAAGMFSSRSDAGKVILADLAPRISGDMDHGFFNEVVDEGGGVRATLAEFDGPGAVTWVWSANPVGTMGLFIDGREQAALVMPFADFLAGRFLPVRAPYASVTSLGHNLHFPIVHAKHCKLVLWAPRRADLSELYFQVAWQSLPSASEIHPFDVADIGRSSRLLRQLARRMLTASKADGPLSADGATVQTTECSLGPGQTAEVCHATGPAAIAAMRFTGTSAADLKGLWVHGIWDGATGVRAPLHMLAGVSADVEDSESLPATVDGPQVTLRWFMPFSAECRVLASNATSRASRVTVEVWTQPIDASHYPLRFHANFLLNRGLQTDGGSILTLAEAEGPGRFVGCVLGVDSRSGQWWGEGDPLIWLDDPSRPAWQGTGTEDYFGFAWCSQGVFSDPFRGQTRVAGGRSHRIAHMHRYHILDQLPFQRWGRFQFEAWGLGKGEMDWTTSIIWYSMDTKSVQAAGGDSPTRTDAGLGKPQK